MNIVFFNITPKEVKKIMKDFDTPFAEMRLNIYSQANRFFLEDEQIIKNAEVIRDIPITLIHGTRDVICLPYYAWRLHKKLPKSNLIFVEDAGHLSSEAKIQQALFEALGKWNN